MSRFGSSFKDILDIDESCKVTNDILDKFIATKSYLAVVFFKEDDPKSTAALDVLEEIDDDLDEVGIMFVKLDDEVGLEFNLRVLLKNRFRKRLQNME